MRKPLYFVGRGKWYREWWVMADNGSSIVVYYFQFQVAADRFVSELNPWTSL